MNRYKYIVPLSQTPSSGQIWRRVYVDLGTYSDLRLIEKNRDIWNINYFIHMPQIDILPERVLLKYFKRIL